MPSALRLRVALAALLGVLLIPVGMSSLRGLTHILTCQEATEVPFSITTAEQGRPTVTSSQLIERGDEPGVCGGLVLNLSVRPLAHDRVELVVPIRNETDFDWHGTVALDLGSTRVPVDVGTIKSGETETDTIEVRIHEGTLEVSGSILVGP